MTEEPSRSFGSIMINTILQKKNDGNIQNLFLNNYKYYDENPEFKKITGKNYDLIISHKPTIPDLVIYNKVFNKNECFVDANENEKNYFPRKQFFIKFMGNEKQKYIKKADNAFSRGNSKEIRIKDEENIKNMKNEDLSNDDENEEKEDDEASNNSLDDIDDDNNNNTYNNDNKNGIENMNKNSDNSYYDNNSIISNNNSIIKDLEVLKKNYNQNNNGNSMIKPESLNQSRTNNIENSFNFEEPNSISYDSYIYNNINNLFDNTKNDFSILSSKRGLKGGNINLQKMNISNINKDIFTSPRVQSILNNYKNKFLNMFTNQMIILRQIELLKNIPIPNNEKIKELNEQVIEMSILSKEGNILGNVSNCFDIFEYITEKILEKNKSLNDIKIYIIDYEEIIEGDYFYIPIIIFLCEISNINIKL